MRLPWELNYGVSGRSIIIWTSFNLSDKGIPFLGSAGFGLSGGWGLLSKSGDGGEDIKCNENIYSRMSMLFPLSSNSSLNNISVIMLAQASKKLKSRFVPSQGSSNHKSWYQVLNSTQGPTVDKVPNSLRVWTIYETHSFTHYQTVHNQLLIPNMVYTP